MRYTQPQSGPLRIDQQWAQSIGAPAVFNANANIATGAGLVSATTVTPVGVGASVVLAASQIISIGVAVAASWSLLMVIRRESQNQYPYFMGVSGGANQIALVGTHANIGGRVGWYDGTTLLDSGFSLALGEIATIGLTFDGATNRYSWFKNGQPANTVVGALTGGGTWQFAAPALEPNTNTLPLLVIASRAIASQSMAALTANPWQLFKSPQRVMRAASGTDTPINPGVGALALTGYSPVVSQTANQSLTPSVGTLAITGYAPTISQPQAVTPGAGSLALTGYAPTITQGTTTSINPATGSLVLSGYAPTVAQTANQFVSPGVGTLAITGYSPALAQSANQSLAPGAGSVVLSGYAPTVTQASPSYSGVPSTATLVLSGYAPAVTQAAAPTDPRYARPVVDVTAGSWLPSAGTSLAAMINEPSADSSTYIYTSSASTAEIALNAVANPGTTTGQIVRYQVWSANANSLKVQLMQGTTLIAEWTHANLPTVPTIYAETLTPAQCSSITNYSDLRFKFVAA